MGNVLASVDLDWVAAKTFIEHAIGFSHDALHVLVGVVLQVMFALLLRRSIGSLVPWTIVLVLELANEAADFNVDIWPQHSMQWGESAKDLLLTMALPSLLLLLVRLRPQLFLERAPIAEESGEPDIQLDG